jgi:hypothetical protein
LKAPTYILPSGIGSPKYLASNSARSTFRIDLTSMISSGLAPSRTRREHFARLSFYLVPFSNNASKSLILVAWSVPNLKNNRLSSANKRRVILGALLETLIPEISPCLSYNFINNERQSATRRNK